MTVTGKHFHRPIAAENRPTSGVKLYGDCEKEKLASLHLSSRCADTLSFFSTRPADSGAKTAAPELVHAIPSPFLAAPDRDRARRSTK
jgi:hypothetical protein